MKVVALISGGKDSCFNALHCVANGHQIVALANLHPPTDQGDELDSHMYQTVGHNVIPLYAQCFFSPESTAIDAPPVPMFRRAISGTSASIGISYDSKDSQGENRAAQEGLDEVEDLFELLSEVKRAIPDVQGVSVGAILSTYQRVRVEHVCQRLGLTVLAYLWQQDQVALLDSMVRAGMNSVLIKVAAMGLNGRHLGKSLAQLQPHLLKMHADFDLHPCGEGGEYETLTLDCPLFRRRLVLHQPTVVEHSPDDMAPVLFYSFDHVTVEDKDPSELPSSYEALREQFAPTLCDPLIEAPAISASSDSEPAPTKLHIVPTASSTANADIKPVVKKVGPLLAISALRPRGKPESLESAVDCVMQQATALAAHHGLSIARDAIFVTVIVRNMSDFARVNAVYGKYFGINPAARACVQSTLPTHLQLDLILRSSPTTPRANLHVQGISYWAPANIGPYSQSVTVAGHVAIAGQIGLVPRAMAYPGLASPDAEFAAQAALARRHLERIARAVGTDPQRHVVGTVAYVSDAQWMRAAREAWAATAAEDEEDEEDEGLGVAPSGMIAVVAVPCLPRNGLVEYVAQCSVGDAWQTEYLANAGRVGDVLDSDDEDDAKVIAHWKGGPQHVEAHLESPSGAWAAEVEARRQGAVVVAFARVSLLEEPREEVEAARLASVLQGVRSGMESSLRQVKGGWDGVLMVRAFAVVGEESVDDASQVLQSVFHDCATSLVPVDAIEQGASILLVVHGHSQPFY